MKGILSILISASIAAFANAVIMEYSEKALNNLGLTNPEDPKTRAFMLNPQTPLTFTLKTRTPTNERITNEAKFKADNAGFLNMAAPHPPNLCGNIQGVHLLENNSGIFCKINTFTMKAIGNPSQPQTLRFRVFFGQHGSPPMVLEIPVFQTPSRILTKIQRVKFANQNVVSLQPPFNSETLLPAQTGGPLEMDFQWLRHLLSLRVSKKARPGIVEVVPGVPQSRQEITMYVTRPLLLSKNLIDSCLNVIASLEQPDDESIGSNSVNGASDDELSSFELSSGDAASSA